MLTRGKDEAISVYGFLVAVEISDSDTDKVHRDVALRLADGPSFIEGVGSIDVECLGKVDIYPEETENGESENKAEKG
jgi:hypothetical protein